MTRIINCQWVGSGPNLHSASTQPHYRKEHALKKMSKAALIGDDSVMQDPAASPERHELRTKFRLWGGPLGDYIGFGGDPLRDVLQI